MALENGAELKSREREVDEFFRKVAIEHWQVRADSAELAETDPNLPKWNDPLSGLTGNDPTLVAKRFSVRIAQGSWGGAGAIYDVFITYMEPSAGGIQGPGFRVPHWNIGTMSQRTDVDIHGFRVGARYFASKAVNQQQLLGGDLNLGPRLDPDAQIGVDVQVPTLELTLRMPSYPLYTFKAPVVVSLMGKVNSLPIEIEGDTIAPDHMLYVGCTAEKIGQGPYDYQVHNHFRIASIVDLPGNVPRFLQTKNAVGGLTYVTYTGGNGYPSTALPIRYGYYETFVAQSRSSQGALLDLDALQLGDEEQYPTADKKRREIIVFEAYKTANLKPVVGS